MKYEFPEESVATSKATSLEKVPSCLVHCKLPDELYFMINRSSLPEFELDHNPPEVSPTT